MLIYDIEIVKGILKSGDETIPGIEYCGGWRDHANMGISCICAFDYRTRRYRVFLEDNFTEFLELARARLCVTFNGVGFDNKTIAAVLGVDLNRERPQYDLLREIWRAAGCDPDKFAPATHGGFGLDAMVKANGLGQGKTGHGALAPVQWQRGQRGAVIDYCLEDVRLTWLLVRRVLDTGCLQSPKGGVLELQSPGDLRYVERHAAGRA